MSEDHEKAAQAAERELAELEEHSEQVGARIDEARADWKAKVADSSVPGAVGDPEGDEDELPPPDPHETD